MELERGHKKDRGGGATKDFFPQESDTSSTSFIDARNGLNKLIYLTMMWTVRHFWTVGSTSAFKLYKQWAQLLLCQPREPQFMLMSQEVVTQGDPLLMVLYSITFVHLSEEIQAA